MKLTLPIHSNQPMAILSYQTVYIENPDENSSDSHGATANGFLHGV